MSRVLSQEWWLDQYRREINSCDSVERLERWRLDWGADVRRHCPDHAGQIGEAYWGRMEELKRCPALKR